MLYVFIKNFLTYNILTYHILYMYKSIFYIKFVCTILYFKDCDRYFEIVHIL